MVVVAVVVVEGYMVGQMKPAMSSQLRKARAHRPARYSQQNDPGRSDRGLPRLGGVGTSEECEAPRRPAGVDRLTTSIYIYTREEA